MGVGINNTLAVETLWCGTLAPNLLGVNVNVAKESATVGTSTVVWNSVEVPEPIEMSKDVLDVEKVTECEKVCPVGIESVGCASGAAGSGVTGAKAVNVGCVSGTCAPGPDLYTMAEGVR